MALLTQLFLRSLVPVMLLATPLIPLPPMPLGGDGGLGAEPLGGPLKVSDPPPTHSKDGATEGLKDPRSGVGDAAGAGATSLSAGDAGSAKLPPPGDTKFITIKPSDFPFVTTVQDDGTGDAGGWQVAKPNLEFRRINLTGIITWSCRFNIEMPLRTEKMGRVDATRAAKLSVEITAAVADDMDFALPQGIFCIKFVGAVDALFKSKYKELGATAVKK